MQQWRFIVSSCLVLALVTPMAALAEHAALRVTTAPNQNRDHAFEAFFKEYEVMVTGWWRHGGEGASAGRWWSVVAAVQYPGHQRPHFVITLTRETEAQAVLVLTFSVPPHAQGNVLLASHAAYDATVAAILGERRGSYEWQGTGDTVSTVLPQATAACPSGATRRWRFSI